MWAIIKNKLLHREFLYNNTNSLSKGYARTLAARVERGNTISVENILSFAIRSQSVVTNATIKNIRLTKQEIRRSLIKRAQNLEFITRASRDPRTLLQISHFPKVLYRRKNPPEDRRNRQRAEYFFKKGGGGRVSLCIVWNRRGNLQERICRTSESISDRNPFLRLRSHGGNSLMQRDRLSRERSSGSAALILTGCAGARSAHTRKQKREGARPVEVDRLSKDDPGDLGGSVSGTSRENDAVRGKTSIWTGATRRPGRTCWPS